MPVLKKWKKSHKRLPFFKYYNVLEWENRFTLGLNAAKNTATIKIAFKQKLFRIKFSTKNSEDAYLCLLLERARDNPFSKFMVIFCMFFEIFKSFKETWEPFEGLSKSNASTLITPEWVKIDVCVLWHHVRRSFVDQYAKFRCVRFTRLCFIISKMNTSLTSWLKQHTVIEFLTNEGCMPKEIHACLTVQFRGKLLISVMWDNGLPWRRNLNPASFEFLMNFGLKGQKLPRHNNIAKVESIIRNECWITQNETAIALDISQGAVSTIIQNLGFEMTRLGSEAIIIRLNTFIFLCRTNPWVKHPRNSVCFKFWKNVILIWN